MTPEASQKLTVMLQKFGIEVDQQMGMVLEIAYEAGYEDGKKEK